MTPRIRNSLIALIVVLVAAAATFAIVRPGGASHRGQTELVISAAVSLKDSLDEIAKSYTSEHSDVKLTFNYGASGALEQQIEQGAPADLFFSAGRKQMDALAKAKLVEAPNDLLANRLSVVVPKDASSAPASLDDLKSDAWKKIAVGQPESVPAGQYAQTALQGAQLWDALQPKLVFGKDVRQVLTYVETGNADAGFVYRTDALTSEKVRVAFDVDSSAAGPIVYPAAVVSASTHRDVAQDFLAYLSGDAAQDVFARYGFAKP
ncbi:molybdate ABC transporter substrate-binding protein [Cohnella sp. REN36]|uniref:molybdate ABC transporter substrate-binding protein n=1 Tax=Cohnella sp. REN36 TaxID=2887347 RepID=UPI001D13C144|nr:molybdate ABC transporter substrate-binding protein [Cohnella sp. REN36]MCC3375626.1 molybdate ABC transporter substrate-binding protein [Cohnella sp. REN36]